MPILTVPAIVVLEAIDIRLELAVIDVDVRDEDRKVIVQCTIRSTVA